MSGILRFETPGIGGITSGSHTTPTRKWLTRSGSFRSSASAPTKRELARAVLRSSTVNGPIGEHGRRSMSGHLYVSVEHAVIDEIREVDRVGLAARDHLKVARAPVPRERNLHAEVRNLVPPRPHEVAWEPRWRWVGHRRTLARGSFTHSAYHAEQPQVGPRRGSRKLRAGRAESLMGTDSAALGTRPAAQSRSTTNPSQTFKSS